MSQSIKRRISGYWVAGLGTELGVCWFWGWVPVGSCVVFWDVEGRSVDLILMGFLHKARLVKYLGKLKT